MDNPTQRVAHLSWQVRRLTTEYRTWRTAKPGRALIGLLGFLGSAALEPGAYAQSSFAAQRTPIYVWGFQEGCKIKSDTTAKVMDRLAKEHAYRVEPLLTVSDQPLPACPGSVLAAGVGCGDVLKRDCSSGQALVLGGVVDHREKATRIRLWLYDLQTNKLAVQDDYCQQCDPDDSKVVATQAAALLNAPAFGASVGPQPSYCQSTARSPQPALTLSAGPLHLGVFGSSARDELRKEIERRVNLKRAAQQQSALTRTDQRGTDPASFETITSSQEGAQVLRIELGSSTAELYLWDQRSRRVASRSVRCTDSCRDAVESISQAAAEILDVCFADRCSAVQAADYRPQDACVDLGKQECPAMPLSSAGGSGGGGLDPRLAQRIEILTGVGLGLSAAVSAGMWIANSTLTLNRTVNGQSVAFDQTLLVPAEISTGLTGGLVALSIPIFYYLEKAKHAPSVSPDPAKLQQPAGFIKCPMPSAGTSASLPRRSRL